MKAIILAAGLGKRMRPLTRLRAKPALPVLNRPLLHWTLLALRAAGVREVLINTHHRPASIRRAVGSGRGYGLRVVYSHERRILGSLGGLVKARRFFGSRTFLAVNGDMVFDFDLRRMVEQHRASRALATLSLQPFPRQGSYRAIVTDPRGRLLSFGGYPTPARGRAWHFTGVQVLEPALLDGLVSGYSESPRDLYGPLIAAGARVFGCPLSGAWYDLSSPPLYLSSQLQLLQQGFGQKKPRDRVCVAATARIGRGARVEQSVIGEGCVIGSGALVLNSVLWDGARVGSGARVEASVLASGARARAGERVRNRIRGRYIDEKLR